MELNEKNKPNNPSLWSKAKAAAKRKFKKYPSAYANLWASKWYKRKGGTWRVDERAFNEERFLGRWVIDTKTGIEFKITAIEFPFLHSDKGQFNIYNVVDSVNGDPLVDPTADVLIDPMKYESVNICEVCAKALMEDIKNGKIPLEEAEYKGRQVKLGKPMKGDVKKYKVYVRDPKTGNIKKVNFGDKGLSIKRDNPTRRKAFRARHKCSTRKDRTSASYWSCRMWSTKPVSQILKGK